MSVLRPSQRVRVRPSGLEGLTTVSQAVKRSTALAARSCVSRPASLGLVGLVDVSESAHTFRPPYHETRFLSMQEANQLVEEFMLLANMSVANYIAQAFRDRAMLRCDCGGATRGGGSRPCRPAATARHC